MQRAPDRCELKFYARGHKNNLLGLLATPLPSDEAELFPLSQLHREGSRSE